MRTLSLVVGLVLLVAGCAGGTSNLGGTDQTPTQPTDQPPSQQTDQPPAEQDVFTWSSDFVEFSDVRAEVFVPSGDGPYPAVVTIHGGGWTGGDPEDIRDLAVHIAESGFLVFNSGYQLTTIEVPGFPGAVHDLACAVRLASHHEKSNGSVAVVGVSAGAHLASLIALVGDRYGEDCPDPTSANPDRLVALGTPDLDSTGGSFFGGEATPDSDEWRAGNPLEHTDANPALRALFIHAQIDTPQSLEAALEMIDALNAVGAIATLEEVAGIGHHSLDDPEHVGDPVVVWLEQYPASRGRPVTVLRGHRTRSSFGPHRAGWTGGDQRTLMAT